jgi:hypothetical protein
MSSTDRQRRTTSKIEVGGPEDELFLQPWFLSRRDYMAVRRILPPSQMLKKKWIRLAVVCEIAGVLGWRVVGALRRVKTMQHLRKLFGESWVGQEVLY